MPQKKMIVVLPDDVCKSFIGDDPLAHRHAEEQIKFEIGRRLERPTEAEQFEDTHRDAETGLLVRAEILETGDVQVAHLGENGDYIIFTGPQYSLQKNEYPGTGTTQLTIKRIDQEQEE